MSDLKTTETDVLEYLDLLRDESIMKIGPPLNRGDPMTTIADLRAALRHIYRLCRNADFGSDEQTEINNICVGCGAS